MRIELKKRWPKVCYYCMIKVMNHSDAKIILEKCYNEALSFTSKERTVFDDCIDIVLSSNHKTFKYILFTELLAKATDSSIDPLSLQKGDTSPGAYDARSLCHKVIVPFEKTMLNKVLGGSNEPFLNKPARFPRLDPSNPVRKGNDKELLDMLCTNLPSITTSEIANQELIYFLHKLITLREEKERDRIFSIPSRSNSAVKLFEFIMEFLKESLEGETLVLSVAGLYHLLYLDMPNTLVEVHPVNEAGSSSKEVSDLDIYQNGKLKVANELKDKHYTEMDVRHAVDKVIEAGGSQMFFIEGIHSKNVDYSWIPSLLSEFQKQNFLLDIAYVETFSRTLLGMISDPDANEYIHYIRDLAENTKFKQETIDRIDLVATNVLGLHR